MDHLCFEHDHCQLQCAECRSYECQDNSHRDMPWLHRRDWMAIATQGQSDPVDDMPDDIEVYRNERAELLP